MATLSLWDIGNCNCGGCACVPCTLPQTNLHVAYLNTANGHTDSALLVYGTTGGPCSWIGSLAGSGAAVVSMGCFAGCSYFQVALFGGGGIYWDSPAHCSGLALTRLAAGPVFTCSPLNLKFVNSTVSWTVTL
jgi:hypothetical protein